MPRHLLQTLSRLADDDQRCRWYYSNYGQSNSPHAHEAAVSAAAATGAMGEMVVPDVERKVEWNRDYAMLPRGGIRAGFHHSVSSCILVVCVLFVRG